MSPELLTVADIVDLLQLSERTVWRNVSTGNIPKPLKIGRCRRWRRTDIDNFIANLDAASPK